MASRITTDEMWFAVAEVISRRATCPRAQCGAVLVDGDGYVVSSGYNGALSGMQHCLEAGCIMEDNHCQRAIHAEVNAITQAAKRGVSTKDCVLYVYAPHRTVCRECLKVIRAAGVYVMER